MKAYKEFFNEDMEGRETVDVKEGTLAIITKVLGIHAGKMTLEELVRFNWLFVDSAFTEIKYILKDSCVVFQELTVDDISRTDLKEDLVDGTINEATKTTVVGETTVVGDEVVVEEITAVDVGEVFAEGDIDDRDGLCLLGRDEDTISTVSLDVGGEPKVVRQISGVAIEIEKKCKPSRQVCLSYIEMAPNYTIHNEPEHQEDGVAALVKQQDYVNIG